MDKRIVIFLVFFAAIISFWRFNSQEVVTETTKANFKTKYTETKKSIQPAKIITKSKRKPTSLKKFWKDKTIDQIKLQLSEQDKVEVKTISKTIYEKGPIKTPAYKVQVVIKAHDGNEYSYNALVNEKNGKLIRTWNKTRYELPTGKLKVRLPTQSI